MHFMRGGNMDRGCGEAGGGRQGRAWHLLWISQDLQELLGEEMQGGREGEREMMGGAARRTWTWRGRQTEPRALRAWAPDGEVWICPESDGEPQKEPFLFFWFFLKINFLFWKMQLVGLLPSPLSWVHCITFLNRREQWDYLLRRKWENSQFSKMNGLLPYWGTASPDAGLRESQQSCPLTTNTPTFQGV